MNPISAYESSKFIKIEEEKQAEEDPVKIIAYSLSKGEVQSMIK